jgi:hypothetical protein
VAEGFNLQDGPVQVFFCRVRNVKEWLMSDHEKRDRASQHIEPEDIVSSLYWLAFRAKFSIDGVLDGVQIIQSAAMTRI